MVLEVETGQTARHAQKATAEDSPSSRGKSGRKRCDKLQFCRRMAGVCVTSGGIVCPHTQPGSRRKGISQIYLPARRARFLPSQGTYPMKNSLLALCLALLLTSCAGVRVSHTDIATGATNPSAIYLRPFDVNGCVFKGRHHSVGERPIRKSLAPAEFTEILKEELEKIAPALVLKDGDTAESGWLVEGSLDEVNSGRPGTRAEPLNPWGDGSSRVKIHVRVIDLDAHKVAQTDNKDSGTQTHAVKRGHGAVVYEFDVIGGSKGTGKFGSITAPGLGYAPTFDYRNAAERIYEALTPDAHRYGVRSSMTID